MRARRSPPDGARLAREALDPHLKVAGAVLNSQLPLGVRAKAAVGAGLFGEVRVSRWQALALGEPVVFTGPGVVAFDGDRLRELAAGEQATVCVRRDGPLVIDVATSLRLAAQRGLLG